MNFSEVLFIVIPCHSNSDVALWSEQRRRKALVICTSKTDALARHAAASTRCYITSFWCHKHLVKRKRNRRHGIRIPDPTDIFPSFVVWNFCLVFFPLGIQESVPDPDNTAIASSCSWGTRSRSRSVFIGFSDKGNWQLGGSFGAFKFQTNKHTK